MCAAVCGMQLEGGGVDDIRAFRVMGQADFVDAVLDACLLLAGDVHYIEGQEFAGYSGEGHVQVDLHFLAWNCFC